MEKITEKRAKELLDMGISPECEVERDTFIKVKSLAHLAHLKNLAGLGVQSFNLYGFSDKEISTFKKIPKSAAEVSYEDALGVLEINGDVFGKVLGNEMIFHFKNTNDIKSFYSGHYNDFIILYWDIKI